MVLDLRGKESLCTLKAAPHIITGVDTLQPKSELVLALSYSIGAGFGTSMPDGIEKSVAFASRTLTQAERKYAQIKKEGLATVFGVKRFRTFLFGFHLLCTPTISI